ncbi:DNA polymerase-3 subunit gamma/tau [Pseudonocardia ammonioxydans]|uniref:DNA polymerase III subunit gamma/tau n=1 Tax=Pseudonocardia ammonioxydans TaxID=260086 RepID=A0A1I4Z818_PSUAM|nr:DNA polymerase-3 subunit gamma/tau [Pseudonocardia ammonioxydans]
MALALYRKYRPAKLADVVGQEHVTEPLATALSAGRINHAYLFSGPRGCGKTSSARILARSLNCVQGPTPEPCGECASCVALAPEGPGNIDVVELDAASHGGVEDARELRDRAFYAPAESRYRIFVVDEAHMVTSQGFNALLKIVEEPPEHLVFVFATTEPDKVLPTIRSRTHHYPFRLIPPGTMRSLLERICGEEEVTVAPPVFPLVIRAGGGSARDTLSVLDQLLAGAGPEGITYERAVALLGVTDSALIDDTVDALAAADGAAVYGAVDRLVEAGHDPRRFASDLLQRLRDLVLIQAVPDAVEQGLIDGADDELSRMADQAARLGPATLTRYGEILHQGLTEMRGATAPRLLLELLCARMLLPAATTSDGGLLERLERIERRNAIAPEPGAAGGGGADGTDAPAKRFVRPSERAARGTGQEAADAGGAAAPGGSGPARGAGAPGAGPERGGPPPSEAPTRSAEAPEAPAAAGRGSGPAGADAVPRGAAPAGAAPETSPGMSPGAAEPADGTGPAASAAGAGAGRAEQAAADARSVGDAGAEARSVQDADAGGRSVREAGTPMSGGGADGASGVGSGSGADVSAGASRPPAGAGGSPAGAGEPVGSGAEEGAGGSARSAEGSGAATGASSSPAAAAGVPGPGDADSSGAPEGDPSPHHPVAESPAPQHPVPESPAPQRPAPESPAAQPPAAERPAAESPTPERPAPEGPAAESPAPEHPAAERPAAEQPAAEQPAPERPAPPRDGAPVDAAPPASAQPAPAAASLDATAVRRVWPEILAAVRQRSRSTEALLVNATVRAVDGDTLVLAIAAPPLARRLSEQRNTDVISDALRSVLGVQWQVRCEAGEAGASQRRAAPERPQRQVPQRPSQRQGGQAAGQQAARPGRRPSGGADSDIPLPPEPPPDDAPPDPQESGPGPRGGRASAAAPQPSTPAGQAEDEEAMLAEAAAEAASPGTRRDPEATALGILEEHLGARPK